MKPLNSGNMGLRIIVFMGIATFLFLALVAFGLKKSLQPQERERVQVKNASSPFDEDRAWSDVEYLVALGPRPAGSEAMKAQQDYVERALQAAGLSTRRFAFGAVAPGESDLPMTSLVGVVEGNRPGIILLCTHFDTLPSPDDNLLGANDGAANTAWLIEMARALGSRRDGRSIWLTFLDGEEVNGVDADKGGLRGSKHLVETLRNNTDLDSVGAVIGIDMIGDCYLTIQKDPQAAEWLTEIIWNTANRKGYGKHFGKLASAAPDGQAAFRAANIPTVAIGDFSYGASRLDHARNWHTANDTPDKVCPESLRAVGDVIYHALTPIDGHLDSTGMHSDGR